MEEALARIRTGIAVACERAGRSRQEVRLVAATKTVPAETALWARGMGVEDFGENYVKELAAKRAAVSGARWHFLGMLQSHTAHHVARDADVVHTLTPGKATHRLSRRAAELGRRLPAMIEIDFTGARTGIDPADLPGFAEEVAGLEGLDLVGLMTLPPMPERPEDARPFFVRLRELRDGLHERHPEAVELSMGMSLDFEVAIEEGATMVRIGTALFGERARPAT